MLSDKDRKSVKCPKPGKLGKIFLKVIFMPIYEYMQVNGKGF